MWLLNILVPGAALIWVGKSIRGSLVAAAYLLALAVAGYSASAGHAWSAVATAGAAGAATALAQVLWFKHVKVHSRGNWRLQAAALRETTEAHLSQGRYREALEAIEGWLDEDPRAVEAWIMLGDVHIACGHADRAQRAYRRAQRLDRHGRRSERITAAMAAARRALR